MMGFGVVLGSCLKIGIYRLCCPLAPEAKNLCPSVSIRGYFLYLPFQLHLSAADYTAPRSVGKAIVDVEHQSSPYRKTDP